MKLPFDIQPTTQNFMIIGMIILGIYLSYTGNLNRISGLIITGIVLAAWLSQKGRPMIIDIVKARQISYDYLIDLQTKNEIPSGRIRMLPEREMKHFMVALPNPGESELIGYKFDILAEVSATIPTYFLIKVGAYGDYSGKVLGITQLTSKESIAKIEPEIKVIHGMIKTMEQKIEDEKKKNVQTTPQQETEKE